MLLPAKKPSKLARFFATIAGAVAICHLEIKNAITKYFGLNALCKCQLAAQNQILLLQSRVSELEATAAVQQNKLDELERRFENAFDAWMLDEQIKDELEVGRSDTLDGLLDTLEIGEIKIGSDEPTRAPSPVELASRQEDLIVASLDGAVS
jgi:hypothetical protein